MNSTTSIPQGMHTVTPHLVCAGATEAIDFYKRAFDAAELSRLSGPSGSIMHASIRIGDSVIMLAEEMEDCGALGPNALKGSPVTIHLYVDDVDRFVERAVQEGAVLTLAPHDTFWGDRYGRIRDPFGHQWSVATHVRDMTHEEIDQAMHAFFS